MTSDKYAELVNKSGFPLQIGVANRVERTEREHGWHVLFQEHSWRDQDNGGRGFIDIVLENQFGTSVLVVECKRVLDASWIFLQPGHRLVQESRSKAWVTRFVGGSFKWFDWFDLQLEPISPESGFCVVPGQDAKSKPMLERIAGDLISATESLAREEQHFVTHRGESFRMYSSVIVTTASLKVCVFDPEKIDMRDGKLPGDQSGVQFEDVRFLRFRKQLSSRFPDFKETEWGAQSALARAKEHTVLVVNSEALLGFLHEFRVNDRSLYALI